MTIYATGTAPGFSDRAEGDRIVTATPPQRQSDPAIIVQIVRILHRTRVMIPCKESASVYKKLFPQGTEEEIR